MKNSPVSASQISPRHVDVAHHDRAHCLAPGLFRSFKRGERKKLKLDITYTYGGEHGRGESIRFTGFEPLGADDMRILQGIIALMRKSTGMIQLDQPQTEGGRQLAILLEPRHEALRESARTTEVTLQTLLAVTGYKTDGGQTREDVQECLRRLASVTIFVTRDKKEWACRLLSYAFDEKTGRLRIAANPRITEAIVGERQYTTIDMREVRALETDSARLLHQRLCGYIDPGKSPTKVSEAVLLSYIWGAAVDGSALRMRRSRLRHAIRELEMTGGWSFKDERGAYLISRREAGYQLQLPAGAHGSSDQLL